MRNKQRFIKTQTWIIGVAFCLLTGAIVAAFPKAEQDTSQWTAATHDRTNFPLIGKHRTVECRECHLNLVFEGTPSSCEACHWERRQDDRYQLRLGAHCADCHTPHEWKRVSPNKWDHTTETGFPLGGIHRTLDCVDCHGDQEFKSGGIDCFSCHEEDYREVREPDHAAAGFPLQCQVCHRSNTRWEGADFSHDFFILRGQHSLALCSACHINGQFTGLPTECYACHTQNFNATQDPDHQYLGFPSDCELCHGKAYDIWDNARFSHDFFALRGEHKSARCSECHIAGQFVGLSQECFSCHQSDYQNTKEPDHTGAGFPADCEICHGGQYNSWEGAKFDHSIFILTGQHKLASCLDCHSDGVYKGRPTDCVSCHLADYNATTDPNHAQLGFPTNCESCHGDKAETWEDVDFPHDAFVLNGQHKLASCSDCHTNGSASISSACASCHLDDYNSTTDPDHQVLGFPLACEACHGTSAQTWGGAVIDHSFWPLQGAHTSLSCSSCHVSGTDLPSHCYGCHADDYAATTDPDHQLAGFPTNCEYCHYPTHLYWSQAVFDHDFPINSGKHSNLDCTDCHLTSNYKEFACIECHAHNKTNMDKKHSGVSGYVYASVNCYACHPDGIE